MEEKWIDIAEYENIYQVSDQGRIRSIDRTDCNNHKQKGKCLIFTKDADGYNRVSLMKDGKQRTLRVARLVAQAFPDICGEWFEGCQVNHKNEVKTDDRAINLEVCTPRYNVLYSKQPMSGRRTQEKYPVGQMENDNLVATYKSMRFAAKMTGISYPRIRRSVNSNV